MWRYIRAGIGSFLATLLVVNVFASHCTLGHTHTADENDTAYHASHTHGERVCSDAGSHASDIHDARTPTPFQVIHIDAHAAISVPAPFDTSLGHLIRLHSIVAPPQVAHTPPHMRFIHSVVIIS